MNLLFYITLSILLNTCTNQNHQDSPTDISNHNEISSFKLKEEFKISEFNDGELFGYVFKIVVGHDSTILVGDPSTQKIHLFKSNGTYVGFLGGYGAGPGEFRRISGMSLLTSDTLQVIDISSARITYYALHQNEWVLAETIDHPESSYTGSDYDIFGFRKFYRTESGYIGEFESTISSFRSDTNNFITVCFISYNENLQLNSNYDPVCYNKVELVVHQNTDLSVQTVSAMPVPEGYQTFYAISPHGDIVTTWTESPIISIRSITQNDLQQFDYHSAKIPITYEMKLDLVKKVLPNEEQSNIQRNQIIEVIPEHKGFASQLLIDDKDQIWVLTNSQDHKLEWLIYDFKGNLKGRVHHPGGNFMQVKNNKIYVAQNSSDVEPSFSVYSIQYQ